MRNFSIVALCAFLAICTPSMSFTLGTNPFDFSVELNEVMTSAFAAYKIADFLNQTSVKPDGRGCWICTLLMSTLEKFTVLQNITIDAFIMNDLCPKVPLTYRPICQEMVDRYGPSIISAIMNSASPDGACAGIGYCGGDFKQCKLFPKGQEPTVSISPDWAQYFQDEKPKLEFSSEELLDRVYTRIILDTISRHEESSLATYVTFLTSDGINPLDWLKELINKLLNNHTAIVDLDNDLYSQTSAELRGYNWRGRDCDDTNAAIHPGRKTDPQPGVFNDFNCNGIKGTNPTTGQNYKDELCANSGQIGVVVMGDSAGAHCEIPTQWVNASQWQYYNWEDLVQSLADEIDLPHMSAYTGYAAEGYHGPASSVYKYMYQRNKCNFRDYQNIAVNGLSSNSPAHDLFRLSRSQTDDFPVLAFLELIGNDVCGSSEDFNHWTTVDKFRTNLIGILDTLDTLLPPGSHLVALGLANGSLIYDGVKGRTHPVGVTYDEFYDFTNCLNTSFCWGWMNTNETVRQATTQRAEQLSQVYSEVFSNYTAKNYDFIYYDFPTQYVWNNWTAAGNDPYLLIEPVDGFHPSQIFHSMLGDYLWESLSRDRPNWLGTENPNNDRITQLFGDQGGY